MKCLSAGFAERNVARRFVRRRNSLEKTGRRLTSDPIRTSLGLLPSGPDPVGEWLVHRQSPGPYLGPKAPESKRGIHGSRRSLHVPDAARAFAKGYPLQARRDRKTRVLPLQARSCRDPETHMAEPAW